LSSLASNSTGSENSPDANPDSLLPNRVGFHSQTSILAMKSTTRLDTTPNLNLSRNLIRSHMTHLRGIRGTITSPLRCLSWNIELVWIHTVPQVIEPVEPCRLLIMILVSYLSCLEARADKQMPLSAQTSRRILMPTPPNRIRTPSTRLPLRIRSSRPLMLCQIHPSTVDTDRSVFSVLVYNIVAYRFNVLYATVETR